MLKRKKQAGFKRTISNTAVRYFKKIIAKHRELFNEYRCYMVRQTLALPMSD